MIRFASALWLILFAATPALAETPGFTGSAACGTCHEQQLDAWQGSHHGWALREPTAENVLGDFNDARFEHKGITSRFFRDGGRFLVETDGADGKLATFEIKYVVGVEPLQQYLVEIDGGRLQALDIAWDTEAKRWYHLYPNEDVAAGNGLHWTGSYKNWQARCAVCHQTDFRKNYDPKARTYQSTWSELTIGCEGCHGPGEAHVAWAQGARDQSIQSSGGLTPHGLLRPEADGRQAVEQNMCGPCHSRREAHGADSTLPTAPLGDHYNLMTLGDGLYFHDGQQDEEVYILGSFLQSKMHEKGVTCSNCHDPHSGGLVAEGNAVCTQCHNEVGREEFPTLKAANYDMPDHHHHKPESAGAQCISCHMPERDYMVIDGRRDHFFRVPDPLLSKKVGSPDACAGCHSGETAEWAAEAIAGWAPDRKAPDHSRALLFAETATQGPSPERVDALAALAQDKAKPAIVRATALREIGDGADPAKLPALAPVLGDESHLVRAAAVRLWRAAPVSERVERLSPLLDDEVGTVRIAAALELASIAPEMLADKRDTLRKALSDLQASMFAKADFPEGQMAIGGLAMTMRNWDAAEAAFAEAVFMDPQLVQAWLARANIAEALGDPREAAAILETARAKNPDEPAIAVRLAPLLVQQGRFDAAVPLLKEITAAEPENQEARINLAFALLQARDLDGAGDEIDRLRSINPNRAEVLLLAGLWQVASGDLVGARETVRLIEEQHPSLRLPPPLDALARMP